MREKAKLMDAEDMERALDRMGKEIIERNRGAEGLILVGIQRRGVYLAKRLKKKIEQSESTKVPCGELDITLYRDDLTMLHSQPMVHSTRLPEDVTNANIFLVDDVLYTGRTIRAALDALMDFGRAKTVRLVALIDRGHRELPIHPDIVGKAVPTAQGESVEVRVTELDGKDEVVICEHGD